MATSAARKPKRTSSGVAESGSQSVEAGSRRRDGKVDSNEKSGQRSSASVGALQLQNLLRDQFGSAGTAARKSRKNRPAAGKSPATAKKQKTEKTAEEKRKRSTRAKNNQETAEPVRETRSRKIEERVTPPDGLQEAKPETIPGAQAPILARWKLDKKRKRQIVKSLIGVALVVAAGWLPTLRLLQVSSVEAIVNARMVTLRTPIEGVVEFQHDPNALDADLSMGSVVAKVTHPRIDKSHANSVQNELDLALIEQRRLETEHEYLVKRRDEQAGLAADFRRIRLESLRIRMQEIAAERAEIVAKLAFAREQHAQQVKLFREQVVAAVRRQESQLQVHILEASLKQASARFDRASLEYETLRDGGYYGDHYNDQPRAFIELAETEAQLAKTAAARKAQDQRVVSLQHLLKAERDNLFRQEIALIDLPVSGRIWEPLVANGEYVNRGQPLFRMLDCTNAVVTASVSEEVYNSLSVGGSATFILRESGEEFPAIVTQLSGVSSAPANLAILPSALEKEPYRATVRVPDFGKDGACLLGKTGRVVFDR